MNDQVTYVVCGECPHPIERHGVRGCLDCDCRELWTINTIRRARELHGLPPEYHGFRTTAWMQQSPDPSAGA